MDNTPQQPEAPEQVQEPAQEPTPEPIKKAAQPAAQQIEDSPLAALDQLAQTAKAQRLSPAEEERAVALLLPLLKGGKNGILSALEPLVALPWIVGVNAISTVWPEWSAIMRRHLLSGLAKNKSDQALRLRLSLARAIFKIELPAALKIAAATLPDLIDAEAGTLTPKHRQIFFNVFIGKGKPWLLQLPLGEFKASDADALVHCAIETFPFCPPLSQLSILRWTHAGGRFKKISEADLATITKSISRWSGKLQRQLKAEIEELPETLTAVFKPAPAQQQKSAETAPAEKAAKTATPPEKQQPEEKRNNDRQNKREKRERKEKQPRETSRETSRETPKPSSATQPAKEHPEELEEEDLTEEIAELEAIDGGPSAPPLAPEEESSDESDEKESRSRSRDRRRERPEKAERPERPERPERTERAERAERTERSSTRLKSAPFDFKESLRGLETYVTSLRNELEHTKAQLRRKEEEHRRGSTRSRSEERPPVDVEALTRHNARLEETVSDLRQQLEDLASHHEAVAESRELHGDEPLPEGSAQQLCKLLSIKLQEDYETYTAMRLEPLDRVFRLDYRDLLGQVFDVLLEQGVTLRPTTPPKG